MSIGGLMVAGWRAAGRDFLGLVGLTLILHFLLSWMGFNPTDEGFTLAYSRRLLEGQIPHRDFIIIRPALSPLLHVPWVAWGGDHTFLLSRLFVVFQFVVIAFCWTTLIDRTFALSFHQIQKYALTLIGFCGTVHYFPLIAWHTTDGLFLISLGALLCRTETRLFQYLGCLLIGMSPLCKQSFLFIVPCIAFLRPPKSYQCWAACLFPALAYGIFLWGTGAFSQALVQLFSLQGVFGHIGFQIYANSWWFAGCVAGAGLVFLAHFSQKLPPSHWFRQICFGIQVVALTVFPLVVTSVAFLADVLFDSAFFIFGFLMLYGLGMTFTPGFLQKEGSKLIGLMLVIAWCSSLSLGINSPVAFLGQMLVLLIGISQLHLNRLPLTWVPIALATCGILFVCSFGVARWEQVHAYNGSTETLTYDLGNVLRGGKGIFTDHNTYLEMAELRRLTDQLTQDQKPYVIVTDHAAHWVRAPLSNPLSIDWPQQVELSTPQLRNQVEQELFRGRGKQTIILSRYDTFYLHNVSPPPPRESVEFLIPFVRNHFSKVQTTEFFELYN